jgi:integrase
MVRVVNRNRKAGEKKYMWLLKGTKTVNGNRIVPLNSKAINAIKNLEAVYNLFNMKHKFIARTRFNISTTYDTYIHVFKKEKEARQSWLLLILLQVYHFSYRNESC